MSVVRLKISGAKPCYSFLSHFSTVTSSFFFDFFATNLLLVKFIPLPNSFQRVIQYLNVLSPCFRGRWPAENTVFWLDSSCNQISNHDNRGSILRCASSSREAS